MLIAALGIANFCSSTCPSKSASAKHGLPLMQAPAAGAGSLQMDLGQRHMRHHVPGVDDWMLRVRERNRSTSGKVRSSGDRRLLDLYPIFPNGERHSNGCLQRRPPFLQQNGVEADVSAIKGGRQIEE